MGREEQLQISQKQTGRVSAYLRDPLEGTD